MNLVTTVCLAILMLSGALCVVRLARSGSLGDRIVALDMLLMVSVSGIAVAAARTGSAVFIDALVYYRAARLCGDRDGRPVHGAPRPVTVADVFTAAALLIESVLALLAAVGLHRFTTVFARLHAATKLMTLGLILIVSAAALRLPDAGDPAKLLLVILLQLLTAPVGTHLVGRAAYRAGTELGSVTVDELADAPPGDET